MTCPHCAFENPPTMAFCGRCGNRLASLCPSCSFANPEGLIAFIREEGKQVKLQPDHRLIYFAAWETPEERLIGARDLLKRLVKIAAAVKRAA